MGHLCAKVSILNNPFSRSIYIDRRSNVLLLSRKGQSSTDTALDPISTVDRETAFPDDDSFDSVTAEGRRPLGIYLTGGLSESHPIPSSLGTSIREDRAHALRIR